MQSCIRYLFIAIVAICLSFEVQAETTVGVVRPALMSSPIGFAATDGASYGIPVCNPVTGDMEAPDGWRIVTCSTIAEINTAMATAKTIILIPAGTTLGTGNRSTNSTNDLYINGKSNITIIGMGGVTVKKIVVQGTCNNVLVRNITITDFEYDGMPITASGHIWVDHCTIGWEATSSDKENPDGAMDIYSNSNLNLTISWCIFRNHWKTMLHGKDDGDNGSAKRHITHYCNYYYNTHQRTPRIRGGQTHVLNCLYENTGFGRTANMTNDEYDHAYKMLYQDDGEYLKTRHVVTDGYGIMATNNSDVVVENNFFYDVRWPIVCSTPCEEFTAKYGELQSPDINNGCVTGRTANAGVKYCRQSGNEYYDLGLPTQVAVKKETASCPDAVCDTIHVPLSYFINSEMLNPGGRSIKFDEHDPSNAFVPEDISGYYPDGYEKYDANEVRQIVSTCAGADLYDMNECQALAPTLTLTSGSLDQSSITSISPIVLTWGGGASSVKVTGLPESNFTINAGAKTVTISGTLQTDDANFSVMTLGGKAGETVIITGTLSKNGSLIPVSSTDAASGGDGSSNSECPNLACVTATGLSSGNYTLRLYDTTEQEVRTPFVGTLNGGTVCFCFSLDALTSGNYTWKLYKEGTAEAVATGSLNVQ